MNLETKNSHLYYLSVPLESPEEMKLYDYREKVARKYKGDLILNNKGHCTIGSFYASDKSLSEWIKYCKVFLSKNDLPKIYFNRQIIYSNHALVLLPAESQLVMMIEWMKTFHKSSPHPFIQKNTRPHISIFRKLSSDILNTIESTIEPLEIKLQLHSIQITKWNKYISDFECADTIFSYI